MTEMIMFKTISWCFYAVHYIIARLKISYAQFDLLSFDLLSIHISHDSLQLSDLRNESWNLLVWMNWHGNNLYDSKQAFFMLSICSVVLLIDRISLVRLVSRFLCHHQGASIRVLPFWYFWEIFPLSSNQSHCVIDLRRHVVQYRKGLLVRLFVCPILH